MPQSSPKAIELKEKLISVGYASDYQKSYGYWLVTIWNQTKPEIFGKAAGMTPLSAYLAAALEILRKHGESVDASAESDIEWALMDRATTS